MGYNYSTSKLPEHNDYKKVSMDENNNNRDDHIYVLTVDNNVVSYDTKFNSIYDEARNIAKNISFKLLTKYGSSFLLSLEEDFDGEDSCDITLFSTATNMLCSVRHRYCNISVLRVPKLGSNEYEYNDCKLTNNSESSEEEEEEDDKEIENSISDNNKEIKKD
jgi:hypothetical protein